MTVLIPYQHTQGMESAAQLCRDLVTRQCKLVNIHFAADIGRYGDEGVVVGSADGTEHGGSSNNGGFKKLLFATTNANI